MTNFTTSEPGFNGIEVALIDPNPNNPRGIPVREDDPKFLYLRESIAEFGILVPLVVVGPLENGRYLLIDGERRFEAAKSIGMETVPAYILSQNLSEDDIRRRMFHIHQNWERWNAAQECRAFEPVYGRLVERFGSESHSHLMEEYARITGTGKRLSEDRIRFLRWPSGPKDFIYHQDNEQYTAIVEIEKYIIEPAQRNYPEYFEKVPVNEVREYLFWKYVKKPLAKGVRDIRDTAGKIARSRYTGDEKDRVVKILVQLAKESEYGFYDAYGDFAEDFPEVEEKRVPSPRVLLTSVEKLSQQLDEYELSRFETATGRSAVDIEDMLEALQHLVAVAQGLAEQLEELAN